MLSSSLYYSILSRDYARTLADAAKDTTARRETAYFEANIGKVRSVDDLIGNRRLYGYVMKAFGLEDMTYAKGLVRKLLQGGVASGSSLANTLNDARYRRLAATFDFAADGAATTQSQAVAKTTVSAYVEQTLESRVGKDNPGTGMALYFRRMAPDIKSAYGILADKTLLGVIQTAFSLSPSMSQQPIERQAATIDRFVKIADLQSPQKVQKLIERFTANYDANQPAQAAAAPTSALGVTSPGISPALLLSIANLRTGGI